MLYTVAVKFSNLVINIKKIKISHWLKIVISMGLICFLLREANWQEVWIKLKLLPSWIVGFYLICNLFAVFLTSIRWGTIIPVEINRQSIRWLSHASYMGLFYSLFLPSSIGGDVAKWGLSRSRGVKQSRLATSILMDRAIGLITTAILVLFIIFLQYVVFHTALPKTILRLSLMTCVFVFIGAIAWFSVTKIPQSMFHKIKLSKIAQSPRLLEISIRSVSISFFISFVAQLIVTYTSFLLLSVLGVNLSFLQFILIFQLISIVSVLPISLGGIGTSEVSLVFLASLFGANYQACLTYVAISIPLKIIYTCLGGAVSTIINRVK